MGILDEAIREHLDLKRRLGAGEDELQRLEDEAFGPPSRPGDPDFPERSDEGELVTGEEVAVAEAPAEAGEAEPPAAEAAIAEPEPASPATEESEQPDFYDAGAEPDEELDLELSLDEEEPAPSADDDAPPISSLDTVEHHYEEAMDEAEVVESEAPPAEESEAEPEPSAEPEDSAEEEEDVLEETPEFLQDAPEDDELWFEQGEPKDFDF